MSHDQNAKKTRAALRHLRKSDQRLARVIDRVGAYRLEVTRDPFTALLTSMIHQQISMKAAATISARVRDLCPRKRMTAANMTALSDDALRGAGLSRQKVRYVRVMVKVEFWVDEFIDN